MKWEDRKDLLAEAWHQFKDAFKKLFCALLGHSKKVARKLRCNLCSRCYTLLND